MKKAHYVFTLFIFCFSSVSDAGVFLDVFESDGITPFERQEVMVGEELVIIISSDVGSNWSGGVFISGDDRGVGLLSGRGFDPNTENHPGSLLGQVGNDAQCWSYRDSLIWGHDFHTDPNAIAGQWFVMDYEAIGQGDPNINFYNYSHSWDDPNSHVTFSQVPSRDFNADGVVNLLDFSQYTPYWLAGDCNDVSDPNLFAKIDLDTNCRIDISDLNLFSKYWLWGTGQYQSQQLERGAIPGGSFPSLPEPLPVTQPLAERTDPLAYQYIITVGPDSSQTLGTKEDAYDYNSINSAIEAMVKNTLDSENLGCIQVYGGTYIEQLNDFYPGGHNLPAHCDLIGMGSTPGDVVIQHQRRHSSDPDFTNIASEIYAYGIWGIGDNVISNLTLRNTGNNQNSVKFSGEGSLLNCVIDSKHDAVTSFGHLTIKDCTIGGKYRPCIHAYSTFYISYSTLLPITRSTGGQHPAGILARSSGVIDHVTINANIVSSDYEPHYDTPWLAGVITQLSNPDDIVLISNSQIDLTLTTLYYPGQTAAWQLFGVVSGQRNPKPTTKYPGRTVIVDCSITLNGIEGTADAKGDGRGIMVAGVCVQGGGEMELIGETVIKTQRQEATYKDSGYEYSVNNQNGEMRIGSSSVEYDKDKINGNIVYSN